VNKIELEVPITALSCDKRVKPVKLSLPFYIARLGKYFHRVRSSSNHWRNGKYSHTSVSFWCGGIGFVGDKGTLHGEVHENGTLCATCEGRAVGAGLDGVRMINGRSVMYSPRIQR